MSLADQLAEAAKEYRDPRGPAPACQALYLEHSTEEDWTAVEGLRQKSSWKFAQAKVDEMLKVEHPLPLEKFRYHWRRRCSCWPEDLRA